MILTLSFQSNSHHQHNIVYQAECFESIGSSKYNGQTKTEKKWIKVSLTKFYNCFKYNYLKKYFFGKKTFSFTPTRLHTAWSTATDN